MRREGLSDGIQLIAKAEEVGFNEIIEKSTRKRENFKEKRKKRNSIEKSMWHILMGDESDNEKHTHTQQNKQNLPFYLRYYSKRNIAAADDEYFDLRQWYQLI